MAGPTSFNEWLDSNSERSYPISELASRTSQDGQSQLPNSLIVDARISVPSNYSTGYFFVSEAELALDQIRIKVAYTEDGLETFPITSIKIEISDHEINDSYAFVGAGVHRSITGSFSIGSLQDSLFQARGLMMFDSEATRFEASIVYVSQPSVQFLQLIQNGREISQLTGVVPILAGDNIRLTRLPTGEIRVDAISGEGLSACVDPNSLPDPIRTINGIPADADGNFELVGGECLSVSTHEASSLLIRDLCSSSCCGCAELAVLVAGLKAAEAQSSTLKELVYRAYAEQSSMIATLTAYIRT